MKSFVPQNDRFLSICRIEKSPDFCSKTTSNFWQLLNNTRTKGVMPTTIGMPNILFYNTSDSNNTATSATATCHRSRAIHTYIRTHDANDISYTYLSYTYIEYNSTNSFCHLRKYVTYITELEFPVSRGTHSNGNFDPI